MCETQAQEYAKKLKNRYRGPLALADIIETLRGQELGKKWPAKVVFDDELPLKNNTPAFTITNRPLDWDCYYVYVRRCLEDDFKAQRLLLAHELCHAVFGNALLRDERICNEFAAEILGLTYDDYISQCRPVYDKCGITLPGNTNRPGR